MNDAIRLLRAQLLLSEECLERLTAVKKALQENTDGTEVTASVQALEPVLSRLGQLEKLREGFLQKSGKPRMTAYAAGMPNTEDRDAVMRLLHKVQEQEQSMKKELASAQSLLRRSKDFMDFPINVMTRTAASDTYTPPGTSEAEGRRGIRMFDANI